MASGGERGGGVYPPKRSSGVCGAAGDVRKAGGGDGPSSARAPCVMKDTQLMKHTELEKLQYERY